MPSSDEEHECHSCGNEMDYKGPKRRRLGKMKVQRVHVYECTECSDQYRKVAGETVA